MDQALTDSLRELLSRSPTVWPRELDWEFVEAVNDAISRDLRAGYVPLEEIVDQAMEYADVDTPTDEQRQYAQQQLAEALRKQVAAQDAGDPCDYGRLMKAFSKLEEGGVLCRENFTCCMTCGNSEIWGEINELVDANKPVKGYVFFHQQDTERAVEGEGLYFAYGATSEHDDDAVAVGQALVEALAAQGLKASWDGTIKKRISVAMQWNRPLSDEVAALVRQTPLPT